RSVLRRCTVDRRNTADAYCALRQRSVRPGMTLLKTHGLTAFYGDFQALYGIDLRLEEGETLAIIGANGAGKSTFLKTIAGLMANPRVLLCDEISLGLAPVVIRNIYAALPRIKGSGASVILVEQDIGQALQVANRVYCFQEGRMSLEGRPAELSRDQIHTAYFGA